MTSATGKKILVVDDDEAILELVQIILDEQGYEVIISQDGDKVYDRVANESPDLILLDYQLSHKCTDRIARYLKGQPNTRDIPIVMFSSHPDIKEIAREVKADNYLPKPFDIDDLLHVVEQYTANTSPYSYRSL